MTNNKSWVKYKNGNYYVFLNTVDGTKIRMTVDESDEFFIPDRPESVDMKITDYCDMGCPWCHENSTPQGKHGDIDLAFIDTFPSYQEIAVGGGNVLSHPDLEKLLEKLSNKQCFASITVNQNHFIENFDYIRSLRERNLIYGIGVSLSDSTDNRLARLMNELPTSVLHCINGILTSDDVANLSGQGLKLLILGYKNIRRGAQFKTSKEKTVENNIQWLNDNLNNIFQSFNIVSFDNLALEQLNVKDKVSSDIWDKFYMGDDGQHTFYIDMVNEEYAISSTSLERYPIANKTVVEMFEHIRQLS